MKQISRRGVLLGSLAVPLLSMGRMARAQAGEVTISHYFTGELGLKAFNEQIAKFTEATGIAMKESPVGHEDFKTDILVRAAGNSLPDVFSYWAGARVQFIVDSNSLHPIDEMWGANGLDGIIAKPVADSATLYNGKRYLVPMNYHYAGMFYNVKVLADALKDDDAKVRIAAANALLDRARGKPKQAVEVERAPHSLDEITTDALIAAVHSAGDGEGTPSEEACH